MTQGKAAKSYSLRGAFRTALAGAALFMAGCAGPAAAPKTANDNIDRSPNCETGLKFAFQSAATPILRGHRTESIFGNDKYKAFGNWTEALGREQLQLGIPGNAESLAAWMSQFDAYKDKTIAEKLEVANAVIDNNFYYERDIHTYGREDYWATPMETIANGQGDCEDLAFLKYRILRYMGVPAQSMYLAVVDNSKGEPGGHIVLMIDTASDGKFSMSESYPPLRTPPDSESPPRKGYTLYYAMNEQGVLSVPANSVPVWGEPPRLSPACIRIPDGAVPKTAKSAL